MLKTMFSLDLTVFDLAFFAYFALVSLLAGSILGWTAGHLIYADALTCSESNLGYRIDHCGSCNNKAAYYAQIEARGNGK